MKILFLKTYVRIGIAASIERISPRANSRYSSFLFSFFNSASNRLKKIIFPQSKINSSLNLTVYLEGQLLNLYNEVENAIEDLSFVHAEKNFNFKK